MNLFRLSIKICGTILLFFILNSCFIAKSAQASSARMEYTEENKAIPPEFGSDSETILLCILIGKNGYDKYLKSGVRKNYNGKYLLISRNELDSEKYSNKEIYRYVFDYTGQGSVHSYRAYYVRDRLEKLTYQSGAGFGFFAKALKVYMENLELKRQSFQN